MKKILLILMLMLACCFVTMPMLHAQDSQDGTEEKESNGSSNNDFPEDPGETDAPFDDGVYLLVIAGAGYGIYTAYTKRKSSEQCSVDSKQASDI